MVVPCVVAQLQTTLDQFQDPVVLCADCALLSHKEHYLTPFTDPNGTGDNLLQPTIPASSPRAVVIELDISEVRRLIEAHERGLQGNRMTPSSTRTKASRIERRAGCCKWFSECFP
jgi:hypothetical protein